MAFPSVPVLTEPAQIHLGHGSSDEVQSLPQLGLEACLERKERICGLIAAFQHLKGFLKKREEDVSWGQKEQDKG